MTRRTFLSALGSVIAVLPFRAAKGVGTKVVETATLSDEDTRRLKRILDPTGVRRQRESFVVTPGHPVTAPYDPSRVTRVGKRISESTP